MTADEYLYDTKEINRVRELAMGVLREPPAPFFAHQKAVLRIAWRLCEHVEARRLGEVAVAPVDVVLDHAKALIVQPDVIFVSAERAAIVRDQVWGAPDLVVEVLPPDRLTTIARKNSAGPASTACANAGSSTPKRLRSRGST